MSYSNTNRDRQGQWRRRRAGGFGMRRRRSRMFMRHGRFGGGGGGNNPWCQQILSNPQIMQLLQNNPQLMRIILGRCGGRGRFGGGLGGRAGVGGFGKRQADHVKKHHTNQKKFGGRGSGYGGQQQPQQGA